MKFLTLLAAIVLASFSPHTVMIGCYPTSFERDNKLNQALTAIISGGEDLQGYELLEHEGYYCYKIHLGGEPLEP